MQLPGAGVAWAGCPALFVCSQARLWLARPPAVGAARGGNRHVSSNVHRVWRSALAMVNHGGGVALEDKIKTALDETRLLILGSQILFGSSTACFRKDSRGSARCPAR